MHFSLMFDCQSRKLTIHGEVSSNTKSFEKLECQLQMSGTGLDNLRSRLVNPGPDVTKGL